MRSLKALSEMNGTGCLVELTRIDFVTFLMLISNINRSFDTLVILVHYSQFPSFQVLFRSITKPSSNLCQTILSLDEAATRFSADADLIRNGKKDGE